MSLHLNAEKGDIAETVLLPGDPIRAKWIAETFLEDAVRYNDVRGMWGFTGNYKGKRISVQGTGMGIPSTLIYVNELIDVYRVKKLIRVGSAGSYQKNLNLNDIVIAMSASTTSSLNTPRFGHATYAPTADGELFIKAVETAKEKGIEVHAGPILSDDIFYDENPKNYKKWAEYGILCVEMESAAIYSLAAKHGLKALTLLTISDSLVTKEAMSQEKRANSFKQMMEIALEIA